MQVLLNSKQMRMADAYTIAHKAITSIDLMENASLAFVRCFMHSENNKEVQIAVFCGSGNNGADGLAIARILAAQGYINIKVYLANFSEVQSSDFKENLNRLKQTKLSVTEINNAAEFVGLQADIIIDALLGSGLNKALSGNFEMLVSLINKLNVKIYAVDVPTGFFADGEINLPYNGIKAFKTICFQRPKINFFMPESVLASQCFEVVNIGLDEEFIQRQDSPFCLTEEADIGAKLKPRANFTHKGTYGHALIIAGAEHTMGAALLAATACLHTGAGLVSASIPSNGLVALNTLLPEVMYVSRASLNGSFSFSDFEVLAIGPGLGKTQEAVEVLEKIIQQNKPLVIDADALNILSDRPNLLNSLPHNTILTPHLKEFDRLFGASANWHQRLQKAIVFAQKLKIVIVLKNQFTFVCMPNAQVFVNPTGNAAMAQGGMGDVLTGVITGFVAQGYTAAEAAILGCFVHGKAGDELAKAQYVVSASQLALQVTKTIKSILAVN